MKIYDNRKSISSIGRVDVESKRKAETHREPQEVKLVCERCGTFLQSRFGTNLDGVLREFVEACPHCSRRGGVPARATAEVPAAPAEQICRKCLHPVESAIESLTPAQQRLLDAVKRYQSQHGMSPTYPELAEILDCAQGSLHGIVAELRRKGYLASGLKGKHRSLALLLR